MNRTIMSMAALAACTAVNAQVTTELFASGLNSPVGMYNAPGDDRFFVIQQSGEIRTVNADGSVNPGNFLDLAVRGGSELGLLGLAFHPDFASNGRFFVNYNPATGSLRTTISEFTMDLMSGAVVPGSERVLLEYSQPFTNHNGGWLGFGPDGYLYIASGDGGSSNDPGNRSAQLNTLLGKMLRIDVDTMDTGLEYGIPSTNPFSDANDGALDEIWAYGLRNPFRNSFDRETGDLWIADVGQNAREEIDFQPVTSNGGEHYGWRCREGFLQNFSDTTCFPPLEGFVDPVLDYSHSSGRCSVTGGFRYRGCEVPELKDRYVFGDFCTGEIFSLDADNPTDMMTIEANLSNFVLSSFAEDTEGELYVIFLSGQIHRLVTSNPMDMDGDGTPDSCEPCLADVNQNGEVEPTDFGAWLAAYNAGSRLADQNENGQVEPTDFGAWLANYNMGCD